LNNVILSINVGLAMNGLLDIPGGPTGTSGNSMYALPQPDLEFKFFERCVFVAPMMVPIDIVDRCGPWPTFVGAGIGFP
jgi:hypothetical protein